MKKRKQNTQFNRISINQLLYYQKIINSIEDFVEDRVITELEIKVWHVVWRDIYLSAAIREYFS